MNLCESHYLLLWALNRVTQPSVFSGVIFSCENPARNGPTELAPGQLSAVLESLLLTVIWGWEHSRLHSHSLKASKWISLLSVLWKPIMKRIWVKKKNPLLWAYYLVHCDLNNVKRLWLFPNVILSSRLEHYVRGLKKLPSYFFSDGYVTKLNWELLKK